ncbi:MAG: T9SS type A sorting domain-containing protein [Bacteroidales bacterium]
MKNKFLQKSTKVLGLATGLLLVVTMSYGQYTSTRIAGGATLNPSYPATAATSSTLEIGSPGPMAVAPNGDIAWSDYYQNNGLVYWDASEDQLYSLVGRGSANAGFGGPASAATVGDRIYGVAFDADNNVWFATGGQVMWVDMSTGIFDLFAGTGNYTNHTIVDVSVPLKEMNFNPAGLVFNDDGTKLYVNSLQNHQVLEIDMATEKAKILMGTGVRADDGTTGLGIEKDTREPFGIDYVKDADGTEWLYVCTQQKRVHKYNIQTGIRSLLAGNGSWAYSGDGGLAIDAALKQPHDLAVDPTNTAVYFGDHQANVVRKVDLRTGIIEKFAGTNESGDALTGNDGPASEAILNRAIGTDFDPNGDMIISERTSQLIRKVDMSTNIISAIAGTATAPTLPLPGDAAQAVELGINTTAVVSIADEVYFYDNNSKVIAKIEADGTTSVYAGVIGVSDYNGGGTLATAQFSAINQMILDSNGDIFASDHGHDVVYKIDVSEGTVSVVAGTGSAGYDAAQEGGPATSAQLKDPEGIAFNADESLMYINDKSNYVIRVVDMGTGNISLYSGQPGSRGEVTGEIALLEAQYRDNRAIAVDADGNVYVGSSRYHKIYKLDGTNATVFAGGFSSPLGLLYAGGLIWVSDNGTVQTVDPATGAVNLVANDVPGSYSLWPGTSEIYVACMTNGVYSMAMDPAGTLATIQGYADADDASALTVEMLNELGAASIEFNLDAYKVAVADSTAATLPYISTVQEVVKNVNKEQSDAVIAAIDGFAQNDDASALELFHFAITGMKNVVDSNLDVYRGLVEDSTAVANVGALQAIIDLGNLNVSLAAIDAMAAGDDASALTYQLMKDAGADAANIMENKTIDYMAYYKAGVEASDGVATVDELNTIITAANADAEAGAPADAIAEIDAMAKANDAAVLSFTMIQVAGADMGAVNFEYLEYYKTGVANADGVADAAALDAIIAAANTAGDAAEAAEALAAINTMAINDDASMLSKEQLEKAGATGMKWDTPHFDAYKAGIEAADGVADAAALQNIIDAANLDLAIKKIIGFAEGDDASAMTNEDLVAAGVDPATIAPANLTQYQAAVAVAAGTDVDESSKIQTLVDNTNAQVTADAIAQIQAMATDGDASGLTTDVLTAAGMTYDGAYLEAYKLAIAGAGSLADAAAIQDLLDVTTTCEMIREMPGSNDAMDLTIEMLTSVGVMHAFDVVLESYQLSVFDVDTIENCGASLQAIVDDVNFAAIQEMAVNNDAADLTKEWLEAVGATDVRDAKMNDYIAAIEAEDAIADLPALQAIIDAVNVVSVEPFGKDAIRIYPNPSDGEFTIEISSGNANLKIVDITGRLVMERELTQSMSFVDLSHEDKGVYFVQLQSAGKLVVSKLVLR